jgi:hypothetical protein
MNLVTKTIKKTLVPERLKYKGQLYKITYLDKKYIIPCYEILLVDKKLDTVYLRKSIHPNCKSATAEFCLPPQIRWHEFTHKVQMLLENTLVTFNLENAYFMPWGDVKYIPF